MVYLITHQHNIFILEIIDDFLEEYFDILNVSRRFFTEGNTDEIFISLTENVISREWETAYYSRTIIGFWVNLCTNIYVLKLD